MRQKIGVVYGNPETTTGGNALKFYCSVRLDQARAMLDRALLRLPDDMRRYLHDHAADLARAMLDRALLRLPEDMRRYLHAARWPFQGCELCEEEARPAGPDRGHHASPPRS